MNNRQSLRGVLLPTVVLLCATIVPRCAAAERIWSGLGGNNNWTTPANWDAVPAAGDWLVFDGSVRLTPQNDFAAGTLFGNIVFGFSASPFALNGNAVTLAGAPGINYGGALLATYSGGSVSNISGSAQTINLPLTLANGHRYIMGNAGGGSLQFNGPITVSPAASVSFSPGVNLSGSGLANVNGILGGWATMEPPTTWATLDGGGNVTAYESFVEINAGDAIASNPSTNLRLSGNGTANTLAGAGVTDINSLLFATAGGNQVVDVAAGRILRFGANGGIFNATRTTGTSRILTIGTGAGVGFVTAGGADDVAGNLYLIETPFIGNTGNQLVMNSRITNNGTGAVTVHTFGHVSFPNVMHTYSGGTYIHGGRVQTQPFILGTGPVHVFPGGQLFFNGNGTCTNDIFIAGFGNAEASGNGAIRMGGTGRIITGTITLTADAATANGTFNGRITGPGRLIVGAGTANGVGTMVIGATNDYSGDTVINATAALAGVNASGASTLLMAAGRPHLMPHGAGKGNLILNGTVAVATFNLNGTDQTINGLSSIGAAANAVVTNGAAGMANLVVGDGDANGSFGGTVANGTGNIALRKIGSGTQTLSGVSTFSGATVVDNGTLAFVGNAFPSGTASVTVNAGATLDLSESAPVTLSGGQSLTLDNGTVVIGIPENGSALTVATLNTGGVTNRIRIASIPAISAYPSQFPVIQYGVLNGPSNFGLEGPLPVSPGAPYAGFISNNVSQGTVDFVVTGGPNLIKWAGYSSGAPNSSWDTVTPNWRLNNGAQTLYSDGAFVRFDDSASNGIVSLNETVSPAGLTISNAALAYTFEGGGGISGSSGLSKGGSGTLILANAGVNDFTGEVVIGGGTLQVGNDGFSGSLPPDTQIINNGTLAFRRQDEITVGNVISGTGALNQNGAGTLVLNTANPFSGTVNVLQGTVRLGNSGALGSSAAGTIVSAGASLDIGQNAINIGAEPVTLSGHGVDGEGALVNSSGSATFVAQNLTRLTLAADATVGGSGRIDLRSNPTSNPNLGSLSTGGQPRKLIKRGSNAFGIIGVTVDPALGDIEIHQGILGLQDSITGLGNPSSNLFIFPGGTLQMFAVTNRVNKVITINSDGGTPSVQVTSGAGNTIIGPMQINDPSTFNIAGAAVALDLDNVITGPGTITKIGTGLLTISGNSPAYAGGLSLQGGATVLRGSLNTSSGVSVLIGRFTLDGSLVGAGGINGGFNSIVAGSGTNAGPADLSGMVFPGDTNAVGTLTMGATVLQPSATLYFDLASATTPGGGTNDLLVVNGDLTINGNMVTVNPLGLLQTTPGNPYVLMKYTGNLTVNGDLFVAGPNNYTFTVNTATPGEIRLTAAGGPPVWNGGSANGGNWSDPANWSGVTLNPGDALNFAGNVRLNSTNDTAPDTFYGGILFLQNAGSFTLSGNPIIPGPGIGNLSSVPQRVQLGLSFSGTLGLNGANGPLIVGGGVTNTSGISTITLNGNGVLTNRWGVVDPFSMTNILSVASNANWSVVNNAAAAPITMPFQVDLLAGTLNFGAPGDAPELISTADAHNFRIGVTPNAPATLNMANGTLTVAARLNTGAGGNTIAAINQTGGTLNVLGLLQVSDSSATASTELNVTGGTLNVGTLAAGQNFFLASRGTGVVTVASSGALNCAVLDVSRNAAGNTLGSVGVVNLDGGVLSVTRVGSATSAAQAGGAPSARFNFNGGVLRARASSGTFFQGNAANPAIPIIATVKAGGAIIDSSTFSITVLEPLIHDSTLGGTPDGGLTKVGDGVLTLAANNTYTGDTLVDAGTLTVNGSISASAVTVANTGILAGTGIGGRSAVVNAGGSIAPAGAGTVGTLTVAGHVTLGAGSTTLIDVNKGAGTADLLRATASTATTITYGGTLSVTNLSGTLAVSDTFKVFSATNYAGSFAAVEPASPAPGLAWDTSTLNVDGILRLTAVGDPTPPTILVNVSANQLNLNWGSTGWRLQVQTNTLATGLGSNWSDVSGSTAVDNYSAPLHRESGAVFFRLVQP